MNSGRFILTVLSFVPLSLLAKVKTNLFAKTGTGVKVEAGEARFGDHYKMKSVTLNTLNIKISGTDGESCFMSGFSGIRTMTRETRSVVSASPSQIV